MDKLSCDCREFTLVSSSWPYLNGHRIYVDILTGENLSSIQVANMDPNYWSVRSNSERRGTEIKGVDRGNNFFQQAGSITLLQYVKNLVDTNMTKFGVKIVKLDLLSISMNSIYVFYIIPYGVRNLESRLTQATEMQKIIAYRNIMYK